MPLNAVEALILGVLHSGSRSCADIVRVANGMELWTFTRSQIYRDAQGLHRAGMIDATMVNRVASLLSITPAGRQAYAEWTLAFPDTADTQIRDGWYLRCALAEHDGSDREAVRAEARAYHRVASAAHRNRGLPLPPPAEAVALSRYHDAMARMFDE